MLPVDGVIAAYNLVLACVWLTAIPLAPMALPLAVAHGLAAALPLLLRRVPVGLPRPAALAREIYPFVALALFWTELGLLQAVRQIPPHDPTVAGWDRAIFGIHLHTTWSAAMPAPWLSEAMYGSYFSYYLILTLPPLALALAGRVDALRDIALRAMVTYLGCFLVYIAFPVYGPFSYGAVTNDPSATGILHALVNRARESGDSPGTAFPSSHVAGALTMAWTGWRWFPRPVGVALVALAILVPFATVYTGNHYTIDAVAGALWAVAAQLILVPALARAF